MVIVGADRSPPDFLRTICGPLEARRPPQLVARRRPSWLTRRGAQPPNPGRRGTRRGRSPRAPDQAPRSAALLRLRPDSRRLRCGDRATVTRPLQGDHDAEYLRTPVADRRGPHQQSRRVDHHCLAGRTTYGNVSGRRVKWPPSFGVIDGKCRRSSVAISRTPRRSAIATTDASVPPSGNDAN